MFDIKIKVKYDLDKMSLNTVHLSGARIWSNHGHTYPAHYAGV